jgi:hypothetical protein
MSRSYDGPAEFDLSAAMSSTVLVHGEAPVPIPRARTTYAEMSTVALVVELVRLSSAPSELFYELGRRAERGDFAGSAVGSADGQVQS